MIFLLDARFRPRDRHPMVARERFDPLLVLGGPLREDLFRNGRDAMHVAEEVNDVLRPGQERHVALDNDSVETVVYQPEQVAKQLAEGFHRSSSSSGLASTTRSLDGGPVEIQSWATP